MSCSYAKCEILGEEAKKKCARCGMVSVFSFNQLPSLHYLFFLSKVRYHNADEQKADWNEHKLVCFQGKDGKMNVKVGAPFVEALSFLFWTLHMTQGSGTHLLLRSMPLTLRQWKGQQTTVDGVKLINYVRGKRLFFCLILPQTRYI